MEEDKLERRTEIPQVQTQSRDSDKTESENDKSELSHLQSPSNNSDQHISKGNHSSLEDFSLSSLHLPPDNSNLKTSNNLKSEDADGENVQANTTPIISTNESSTSEAGANDQNVRVEEESAVTHVQSTDTSISENLEMEDSLISEKSNVYILPQNIDKSGSPSPSNLEQDRSLTSLEISNILITNLNSGQEMVEPASLKSQNDTDGNAQNNDKENDSNFINVDNAQSLDYQSNKVLTSHIPRKMADLPQYSEEDPNISSSGSKSQKTVLELNDSIIFNDNKIRLTDLEYLHHSKTGASKSLDFGPVHSQYDLSNLSLNFEVPLRCSILDDKNVKEPEGLKLDTLKSVNFASHNEWYVESDNVNMQYRSINAHLGNDHLSSARDSTLIESLISSSDTGTSSTEYKTLCEEYTGKLMDFQSAITDRDKLIEQLSESLQKSLDNRQNIEKQSEKLSKEVEQLRQELLETTLLIEDQNKQRSPETTASENVADMLNFLQAPHISNVLITNELQKFEHSLTPMQLLEFADIKYKFQLLMKQDAEEMKVTFEEEIKNLKDEKKEWENEVSRLRQALCSSQDAGSDIFNLREQLQTQHQNEMEELRTYFEKKCAELEKHYAEDVFSQQSRRLSGASSDLSDIGVDLLYSPRVCEDVMQMPENAHEEVDSEQELNAVICSPTEKEEIMNPTKVHISLQDDIKMAELNLLKQNYEDKIKEIEDKHRHEMDSFKRSIDKYVSPSEGIPEHADNETALRNALEDSERRLQEQVMLARQDILNTIEEQIQALISDTTNDETQWPTELVELKNKFTTRHQEEIDMLKMVHDHEIAKLRADYEKRLTRKSHRNLNFDSSRDLDQLVKERNNLKKMTHSLRSILSELAGYFSVCENELNNTLWGIINKVMDQADAHSSPSDTECDSLNTSNASNASNNRPHIGTKRVHFAPDFSNLITLIGDDSLYDIMEQNKDVSADLRNELDTCLDRLKTEAAALLGLTSQINKNGNKTHSEGFVQNKSICEGDSVQLHQDDVNYASVQNELVTAELTEMLTQAEAEKRSLASDLVDAKNERDSLKLELTNALEQLSGVISESRTEIVAEGYGERNQHVQSLNNEKPLALSELRDRTLLLLSSADQIQAGPNLMHLIEELCREGDRVTEESKKDKDDLQLQVLLDTPPLIHRICCQKIEAADKLLRSTRQFLEEQAIEREQERDDITKEIHALKETLKERERDKQSQERVMKEVEHLEQQMREMNNLMAESQKKKEETEIELKAAIDKIFVLREIITELENQIENKSLKEHCMMQEIDELKMYLEQQNRNNEQLGKELDSLRSEHDVMQLTEKIGNLEEQLHNHRLTTENTEVVMQMKQQLNEIESSLDSKTRLLESLHAAVCSTSCSSEDVSMRDHQTGANVQLEDPPAPLEHIIRVWDKLQRHSKAEEAALKRIRDLEMQVSGVKQTYGELQAERDILQERLQQQLVRTSSLQSRLDEQRRRTDSMYKQNTSDLNIRIHELQSELTSASEILENKDKQITQLKQLIEQSRVRIAENENDLSKQNDGKEIRELNLEISKLQKENKELKNKVKTEMINKLALPDLMDTILEEKNADIDHLKEQLERKEKELEIFTSLNLDNEQIKQLQIQAREVTEGKLSARTLSDILSISEYDEPEIIRKEASKMNSLLTSNNKTLDSPRSEKTFGYVRRVNETTLIGGSKPKSMENISFNVHPNLSDDTESLLKLEQSPSHMMQNKLDLIPENEESSISESGNLTQLQNEIANLQSKLEQKLTMINDYERQLTGVPGLQIEINDLKINLQKTIEQLDQDKMFYQNQFEKMANTEKNLNEEVKKISGELEAKLRELSELKNELSKKDALLLDMDRQKSELLDKYNDLECKFNENSANVTLVNEKLCEINELKVQMQKLESLEQDVYDKNFEIENLKQNLVDKSVELQSALDKCERYELTINNNNELVDKLTKDIKTQYSQMEVLNADCLNLRSDIANKDEQLNTINKKLVQNQQELSELYDKLEDFKKTKEQLTDKVCEVDILNEDVKYYQEEISNLKHKLNNQTPEELTETRQQLSEKIMIIEKLKLQLNDNEKEVLHLTTYLQEKDKVITQISQDSKSLHSALATIQSKLFESGNVLDLAKRLKEEQKNNENLTAELKRMKDILAKFETANNRPFSIDDIATKVQKELDLSAQLDSNILHAIESDELNSEDDDKEYKNNTEPQQVGENDKITQLLIENENLHVKIDNLRLRIDADMQNFNDLVSLKERLEKDTQQLEHKLRIERENCKRLQVLLDSEKQACNDIQIQDADLIESLRIRLQEALSSEASLRKLYEAEKISHDQLDAQLEQVQLQARGMTSPRSKAMSPTEKLESGMSTPARSIHKKELELQEEINERLNSEILLLKSQNEREKDRLLDLQNMLDREKMRFQKEIKDRNYLMEKLKSEMGKVMEERSEITSGLNYAQEKVSLQEQEIANLETRLQSLQAAELRRSQRKDRERHDVLVKMRNLEDIQSKCSQMERQLASVQGELDLAAQREILLQAALNKERQGSLTQPHHETDVFLNKLKEMSTLLSEHVAENRQMAVTLAELRGENGGSHLELNKDIEDRTNHIFGKYLRCESYRKALVWQKSYLLVVTQGYRRAEQQALKRLGISPEPKKKLSSKSKFKSAVYAVVAIHRMQFLVRRWHAGKMLGAKITLGSTYIPRRSASSNNNVFPTPMSPPCRDRAQPVQSRHISSAQTSRDLPRDTFGALSVPLQAPSIISDLTVLLQRQSGLLSQHTST